MVKITFSLPFVTLPGEEIHITGSVPELKGNNPQQSKPMKYSDGLWKLTINIKNNTRFIYSYLLKRRDGYITEAGAGRKFDSPAKKEHLIYDFWRERNSQSVYYSTPFTRILFNRNDQYPLYSGEQLTFNVFCPNLPNDTEVVLCGNSPISGNWMPQKGLRMRSAGEGMWSIGATLDQLPDLFEYKYVVQTSGNGTVSFLWEEGFDRKFIKVDCMKDSCTILNDHPVRIVPHKVRLAGSAVPLFALRSQNSCGIGDFGDLRIMIDLISQSGMNLLQLLPLNDTTRSYDQRDSYPYSAISGYAIHPVYMNLEQLGRVKEREFRERFIKKRAKLNNSDKVDWESVIRTKWLYIKQIFRQDWDKLSKSKEFKAFYKNNESWLLPYAVYSHLRDRYHTANYTQWPRFRTYDKNEALSMLSESSKCREEIEFYFFVQYHLQKQLSDAHQYAVSKKVILKGDIPIGIDRYSVEAWTEPHLFDFSSKAGAPPDYFSEKGQVWGFPLYNWYAMELEGFSWWRERIAKMAEFFDAYRIDHILGFFRIWNIPVDSDDGREGTFEPSLPFTMQEIRSFGYTQEILDQLFILERRNPEKLHPAISAKLTEQYHSLDVREKRAFDKLYGDYFYHRHDQIWKSNGIRHLQPLLSSSGMLACGEDLGMVPPSVPEVMDQLKILTLELERMPKGDSNNGNPATFPYLSVCSTSTHDTETMREWWVKYGGKKIADYQDCPQQTCREIVDAHMKSQSMLCIIPLQDLLAMFEQLRSPSYSNERINNPADPHHIWDYRIHIMLEELSSSGVFQDTLREMVKSSGRGYRLSFSPSE